MWRILSIYYNETVEKIGVWIYPTWMIKYTIVIDH